MSVEWYPRERRERRGERKREKVLAERERAEAAKVSSRRRHTHQPKIRIKRNALKGKTDLKLT